MPIASAHAGHSGSAAGTIVHSSADALRHSFDRRTSLRHRTVYRLVTVTRHDEVSLCHLCNVSDEGLMLALEEPVNVGDRLVIGLSEDQSLLGTVVWAKDGHCGVELDAPIDCEDLLRVLAAEQRSKGYRPPRIQATLLGVAYSEVRMHPVRTTNLSQRGMGLTHDGRLQPGQKLLVMLENGVERRGVVRWSHDHSAGLLLTEPLDCCDLNRCVSGSADGRA